MTTGPSMVSRHLHRENSHDGVVRGGMESNEDATVATHHGFFLVSPVSPFQTKVFFSPLVVVVGWWLISARSFSSNFQVVF